MVMVVVVLKIRKGRALVLSLSSRPHHFEGASKPGSGCPSHSLFVGGSPAPYPFHQSLSAPTLTYPPQAFMLLFRARASIYCQFLSSYKAVAIPMPTRGQQGMQAFLAFPFLSKIPMTIFPSLSKFPMSIFPSLLKFPMTTFPSILEFPMTIFPSLSNIQYFYHLEGDGSSIYFIWHYGIYGIYNYMAYMIWHIWQCLCGTKWGMHHWYSHFLSNELLILTSIYHYFISRPIKLKKGIFRKSTPTTIFSCFVYTPVYKYDNFSLIILSWFFVLLIISPYFFTSIKFLKLATIIVFPLNSLSFIFSLFFPTIEISTWRL